MGMKTEGQEERRLEYSCQFNNLPLKVFNRPREIYRNHIRGYSAVDGIMLGQLSQPTSESDRFFSDQVTSKLFSEAPPNRPGTDLPSLNMQRGRDHGLPG